MVRQYMTRLPVEVEGYETVTEAIRIMKWHRINHVPVMSGSHLTGIVSDRDILKARVEHGQTLDKMTLDEICRRDTVIVSPVARIDEAARHMLDQGTDSALVVDSGFVVGIFTTTDALRLLCELGNV